MSPNRLICRACSIARLLEAYAANSDHDEHGLVGQSAENIVELLERAISEIERADLAAAHPNAVRQ